MSSSRTILLAALGALFVLALMWFVNRPQAGTAIEVPGSPRASTRATAESSSSSRVESTAPASESTPEPVFEAPAVAEDGGREAVPATNARPLDCHAFGVCSDGRGHAVDGVEFILETWESTGHPGLSMFVARGVSDAEGRFSLRFPMPSDRAICLQAKGPKYFGVPAIEASGSSPPSAKHGLCDWPVALGENDFGRLTFPPAGAIEGMVRGRDGLALGNALLRVSWGPWPTLPGYSLDAVTKPMGQYSFGNLQHGVCQVAATCEGYSVSIQEAIVVEDNQTTQVDFSLEPATRLRVFVRDRGAPLSMASVHAHCSESPHIYMLRGRSDSKGQIEGEFTPNGPLELRVFSEAGLFLGRSALPIALVQGTLTEARVDLQTGTGCLRFPSGTRVPDRAIAHAEISAAGLEDQGSQLLTFFGADRTPRTGLQTWTVEPFEIGRMAPAEYSLTVRVETPLPSKSEGEPARKKTTTYRGVLLVQSGSKGVCDLAIVDSK